MKKYILLSLIVLAACKPVSSSKPPIDALTILENAEKEADAPENVGTFQIVAAGDEAFLLNTKTGDTFRLKKLMGNGQETYIRKTIDNAQLNLEGKKSYVEMAKEIKPQPIGEYWSEIIQLSVPQEGEYIKSLPEKTYEQW